MSPCPKCSGHVLYTDEDGNPHCLCGYVSWKPPLGVPSEEAALVHIGQRPHFAKEVPVRLPSVKRQRESRRI